MDLRKEIEPLKSLEEVLDWLPPDPQPHSSPWQPRSSLHLSGASWRAGDRSWDTLVATPLTRGGPGKVKSLVCHDMMGGYLEDRFLAGCEGAGAEYTFRHWALVDVWVYFSHHFVTIPPVGWVAAGRRHGVAVLGTIITEWAAGQQLLESILASPDTTRTFVAACVRLARHYGFQGWLLNIENPVTAELVPRLLGLVDSLTRAVRRELGPGAMVLWYDSVTVQGDLSWQNQLNSLNKPFFDVCDGVFLNYTWTCGLPDKDGNSTPDLLANSISALENDSRRTDIFVGVDVFGRGCLGGGGFQCDQAVKEIIHRGLSLAIFAPGWTYEIPHREWGSVDRAQLQRQFFVREHTFWGLLEPFLNFHGPNLQSLGGPPPAGPAHTRGGEGGGGGGGPRGSLRFKTCFSLGLGRSGRPGDGSRPAPGPGCWYNLTKMEFQPSLVVVNEGENNERDVLGRGSPPPPYTCFISEECSFRLSHSLKICSNSDEPVTVPIFILELPVHPEESILYTLTLKTQDKERRNDPRVRLGTESGQELVPRMVEEDELQEMEADPAWDVDTGAGVAAGWTTLGFLLRVEDRQVIHKMGVQVDGGAELYIGELAIYKKRP